MDSEYRLSELKSQIEKLNIDYKVQSKNFDNAMKEIKDEYDITSIAQAKDRIEFIENEKEELEEKRDSLIAKIKNELDKYEQD